MVKTNPDTLEQFYQTATGGLDQSLKRYRSPQLAVVDLDTFIPSGTFQDSRTPIHQTVYAFPDRLNPKGLNLLQYSSAKGVVAKT